MNILKEVNNMDIKNEVLETLENELKVVPMYNAFGDNNHTQIKCGIDFIKGKDRDVIEEELLEECDKDYDEVYGFLESIESVLNGSEELKDIIWNESSIPTESKKPIVCKKMCGDCPFSKKSTKGFLADYTVQDFVDYHRMEVSFPCHKVTPTDMDVKQTHQAIQDGSMHFCRGYVESVIKSCKMPLNPLLKEAIEIVKKDGLSDDSMSIHDFVKNHTI